MSNYNEQGIINPPASKELIDKFNRLSQQWKDIADGKVKPIIKGMEHEPVDNTNPAQ